MLRQPELEGEAAAERAAERADGGCLYPEL